MDIGNSSIKAGVFLCSELQRTHTWNTFLPEELEQWIGNDSISQLIVSSTAAPDDQIVAFLKGIAPVTILNSQVAVPINNRYDTPETLGADRLAGVVGASILFPGANCLVIDAGTCITYDFLDAGGVYQGGAISPGLDMRAKAMHHFTGRLPLIEPRTGAEVLGKTTQQSLQSGVWNGVIFEMEGMIKAYQSYDDLHVIITGGNHKSLAERFKTQIFAAPNLVLYGLNEILLFNADR